MDERRRVSKNHERSAAKKLKAKQHAGSGSGARKHDMHTQDHLIENKTVLEGNRQITIKADDLKSLSYHAALQGRIAVLHVRLAGKNWVLITEDDFVASCSVEP